MNILLAVDGSPFTKKAVAFVLAHQEEWLASGQLHVLNVQMQMPPRVRAMAGADMVRTYLDEQAQAVLRPIRRVLDRSGLSYTAGFAVGHAAEEIVKAQERTKSHMIAMGSHGHGSALGLIMGSVAQTVLSRATVPVLVVR
jgi:nucleotide-binding universal stress UspA family protein